MRDKERWRLAKKKWYQANKAQELAGARRRKYGLTPEAFKKLLVAQDYKCAICRAPNPTDVDHCHHSQIVRGLLCRNCNMLLGSARDSITVLNACIQYLALAPYISHT